jgi:hypothetical protein
MLEAFAQLPAIPPVDAIDGLLGRRRSLNLETMVLAQIEGQPAAVVAGWSLQTEMSMA